MATMATANPFAAIEACFANDRKMISSLIEEKHALRVELAMAKAELRTQRHLTELARDVSRSHDRSRSPRTSPAYYDSSILDATEQAARDIFRDILMHQYMAGHPCGKDADNWLRMHGGWFRDPQEEYGDGTYALKDESLGSSHHDAMEEAFNLITKLEKWLIAEEEDDLHRLIKGKIKKLRSNWVQTDREP